MTEPAPVHTSLLRTSEAIDLVFVAAGIALQFALPLAPARDSPGLRYVAGAVFLVATVFLVVSSMKTFKAHKQSPKPNETISRLITTGPFAYTRNPIYLASATLFVTLALLFANYWFAILLPLLIVAFNVWMIQPEERFLKQHFGDEYTTYCSRVRRWI